MPDPPMLTFDELKRVFAAVKGYPTDQLVIRLLANGISPTDILSIKPKDYSSQKGVLNLGRTLEMDPMTAKLLQEYYTRMEIPNEERILDWAIEDIARLVRNAGNRAGLSDLTPDHLRGMWIFVSVHNGLDYGVIHRQLGCKTHKETAEAVAEYKEVDDKHQDKVLIYIQVTNPLLVESTLIAVKAVDYVNYEVVLGSDKLTEDLAFIAQKYKATIIPVDPLVAFKTSDCKYLVVARSGCVPLANAIKKPIRYFNDARYQKAATIYGLNLLEKYVWTHKEGQSDTVDKTDLDLYWKVFSRKAIEAGKDITAENLIRAGNRVVCIIDSLYCVIESYKLLKLRGKTDG